MARGIERVFDRYSWMIFGENESEGIADVYAHYPGEDIITLSKEKAELIVGQHNKYLYELMEEIKELYDLK